MSSAPTTLDTMSRYLTRNLGGPVGNTARYMATAVEETFGRYQMPAESFPPVSSVSSGATVRRAPLTAAEQIIARPSQATVFPARTVFWGNSPPKTKRDAPVLNITLGVFIFFATVYEYFHLAENKTCYSQGEYRFHIVLLALSLLVMIACSALFMSFQMSGKVATYTILAVFTITTLTMFINYGCIPQNVVYMRLILWVAVLALAYYSNSVLKKF